MENLTHSLVGLAVAKAGLERLSPGATVLCVLAANAPDADVVTTLWGRWSYLHHHRGITHSILGTLALGVLLPLLFYGVEKLFALARGKPATFKLGGLLTASLVATVTHPFMDWTNNYGLRPLLPWSGKWFYGDLVFIVDPWIWLTAGGACFLLTSRRWLQIGLWTLLALILTTAVVLLPLRAGGPPVPLAVRIVWVAAVASFLVARRLRLHERFGRKLALGALSLLLLYWIGLGVVHARAYREAAQLASDYALRRQEQVKSLAVMPVLADPTLWRCVAETEGSTFLFHLEMNGGGEPLRQVVLYEKPRGKDAVLMTEARTDERARIFLEFARFPVAQTSGDCVTETFVQFADLRYTEPSRGRQGTFSLEVPVECPPEAVERQEEK
jgi:inner membrane protein